jgi:hypothetical protein
MPFDKIKGTVIAGIKRGGGQHVYSQLTKKSSEMELTFLHLPAPKKTYVTPSKPNVHMAPAHFTLIKVNPTTSTRGNELG